MVHFVFLGGSQLQVYFEAYFKKCQIMLSALATSRVNEYL